MIVSKKKGFLSRALLVLAMSSLLVGCGTNTVADKVAVKGAILLSINPEIEITYNKKGDVVALEGKNADGQAVVDTYTDYEGKNCETVVNDLVKNIYEAGYFKNTVDGHDKNIVVKLEAESECPNEQFMENVISSVQEAADNCGLESSTILVTNTDLDVNGRISEEKAKELVLSQLGLENANFIKCKYDEEENAYELDFEANGITYEYEVNAVNGKVLEAEINGVDMDDDDKNDVDDDSDDDDKDDVDDDSDDDDKDDVDDDSDDDKDDIDDDSDDDKDDVDNDLDDDDKDDIDDDSDDDDKDDVDDDSDDNHKNNAKGALDGNHKNNAKSASDKDAKDDIDDDSDDDDKGDAKRDSDDDDKHDEDNDSDDDDKDDDDDD